MIQLKSEKRRKPLHFDELWFQLAFFIFTNTKIKYQALRMTVFSGYIQVCRNASVGKRFEIFVGKHINYILAGLQHFIFEISGHKYGCFGIPEIECTWCQGFNFLHVLLVLLRGKVFVESLT